MKRRLTMLAGMLLAAAVLAAPAPRARAQNGNGGSSATANANELVVQAREAHRAKDKARLATLREQALGSAYPLAMWVHYFDLHLRLTEVQQAEFDAFAARWSGTYVEDRLRNDWLLELGKRRDWVNFRAELPRFRMNDDREVACYALLVQHQDGQDVRVAAKAAWYAQRDLDDGCQLLGQSLYDARVISGDDVWQEIRLSVEANRPTAARAAAALLDPAYAARVDAVFKDPAKVLREQRAAAGRRAERFTVIALWRLAAADPDAAVVQLDQHFATQLSPHQAAHAWAGVAKQAALKLHPRAADYARRAWLDWERSGQAGPPHWSDDMLAWHARAALRQPAAERSRWTLLTAAIDAMSAAEQRSTTWTYWRARALQAQAPRGPEGDEARAQARGALEALAPRLDFYGQLAAEDLGRRAALPAPAAALTPAEVAAPRAHAGLGRGLALIGLGLRGEGVREWNYSLRGLDDRQLLAAAQWACEREVWDRCINTSDRTRAEFDLAQRYPMPFREQVVAQARKVGIEAALVYGLIRQESRFVMDARSSVGASGLMQLMPATARWTARKVGLDWRAELITDRDVNLHLGMSYLRMLLDDFGGSPAMATAAYNAGPGRPRRWREGTPVEPAAWIEGIPFNETRDYVKKVLSNTLVYAALLGDAAAPPLKARLGPTIGPREPGAAPPDRDLP